MVSKGIIIVAIIIIKTTLRPLNLNLASPYPTMAERITVVNTMENDTIREFKILRRYIKEPSFPAIARTKLAGYGGMGIHL